MSEEKKVSSTDVFKEHVQSIIYQELGVKVAKDKAWKLFKAIVKGTIQHVTKIDGNKMSLAGVGTFVIGKSPARGKKEEMGYPWVPRFRFKPSSVVAKEIEKAMGAYDHQDVTVENYGLYKETPAETAEPVQAPAAEPMNAPVDDFLTI